MATVRRPNEGQGTPADPVGLAPAPPPERRPAAAQGLKVRFSRGLDTAPGVLDRPFYFQCSPTEAFRWSAAFGWSDYQTIRQGTFSRPVGAEPIQIQFSTLFVDHDPRWAAYRFGTDIGAPPVDPLGWSADLLAVLRAGTPFNVLVGQPLWWGRWDVRNLPMTLRNLEVEERAGEADTRYVDVQLVEHREVKVARRRAGLPQTVTLHEDGSAAWDHLGARRQIRDATLAKLAKQFYKSPGKWIRIRKANRNLRGWSAHRELASYVKRHGSGRKGRRVAKITVPDHPRASGSAAQAEAGLDLPTVL